ncbi:TonB-dependent receptor [Sphingobium phenoxybenzoativorans]|uniref:TonB-dependent receptor n=1 Tax=Sphingobium phenoxybenzoativorans TaxID=1592790 RepID=A0A975KB75_9SPHN|nr:TonB-dependent receptor [Sphingobium phenoxybenzoativorans]QUT07714.1 TonB-dependent receptor [Sphingobium phenoxybenzoativorans]
MSKSLTLASLLLLSSALVAPAALAQSDVSAPTAPADGAATGTTNTGAANPGMPTAAEEAADQSGNVDVSIPGADIVVVGRRGANIERAAPQVVSVLSAADIKRTGEGDIAGSLQRVTGLSVVGGGYVYVRGLGDRYSLALLNGAPLPSPEPLKRVVPLDIFPTSVIASTLVQKSFSPNFPGEFGGGVINLTTKAIPAESYLEISGGVSGNSETTGKLGYTYFGSGSDWTGFDSGSRDVPPLLQSVFDDRVRLSDLSVTEQQAIAMQFKNARTTLLQKNNNIPVNWSASLNGGTSFDMGGSTLGVIATASISNKWRTRDALQQASIDLTQPAGKSFEQVTTDNEITVNGLVGVGLESDVAKARWTALYIRDTLKRGQLAVGQNDGGLIGADYMQQNTAWYERQLLDLQFTGEFKLSDPLSFNVRASYANSQREAPYEREFEYVRSSQDLAIDPVGNRFINRLDRQRGDASVTFSDLNEDLMYGGADLTYELTPDIKATVGYAYQNTERTSSRYELHYDATNLPIPVQQQRPDYLTSDYTIQYFGLRLLDFSDNYPIYEAKLRVHGAYGQLQAQITPEIALNGGVRFESGRQEVTGRDIYLTGTVPSNTISKEYWLPAATLTWEFQDNMQLRFSGSKTIARPQFREQIAQIYIDTESSRAFRGNPYLLDSTLWNADARYEWYFARDQRVSIAGFYKSIKNPIEAYTTINDRYDVVTSFANAPKATLYGAEIETQKYFDLSDWSSSGFFASRRAVLIANYTYTQSKIKVGDTDTTIPYTFDPANGSAPPLASDYFIDGRPMTGQSDHLVNLQIGLEDTDRLSQQTLLLTYASKRVTSRGPNLQPDIIEQPGLSLDFVARQGIVLGGVNAELKVEARNITGRKYKEFQSLGDNRVYYNLYDIGTSYAASLSVNF